MKNAILIIFLVLVAMSIYTYSVKKNALDSKNSEYTSQVESRLYHGQTKNENAPSKISLDGKKDIDTIKSIFHWSGQKVVLKNWIDKGIFLAKSGSVYFKEGKIQSAEVVVDMNSINAQTTGSGKGQDGLTKHLKSDAFFDVAKYPTAKISITENTNNILKGKITIKDVTQDVVIPVEVKEIHDQVIISGKLTLDRSLFNIKFGSNTFFDNLGDKAIDNMFTINFTLITK